jgi:uncharacterized protein YndB with AHSA1/START domain
MSEPWSLNVSIRIEAGPSEVFPYFIEPGLIVKWLGDAAELDPAPGGRFAIDFAGTSARGTYLVVDPPKRVVFTWGVPGDAALPPGSTTVEVRLTPDGDGTIVELIHLGLPANRRVDHEAGWKACLAKLDEATSSSPAAPA